MNDIGGFRIEYRVRGGASDPLALHRMSAAFDRAGADFTRFGEFLFPELVPVFEDHVGKQFRAEGHGPNRGAWSPLTPKYAARKRKVYGQKPVLEATGTMRAALTESSSPFANRAYTATQFNFGTQGVPYASFHQSGTKKMVDRPPYDFTPEFEAEVNGTARTVARQVVRSNLDQFASVAP